MFLKQVNSRKTRSTQRTWGLNKDKKYNLPRDKVEQNIGMSEL